MERGEAWQRRPGAAGVRDEGGREGRWAEGERELWGGSWAGLWGLEFEYEVWSWVVRELGIDRRAGLGKELRKGLGAGGGEVRGGKGSGAVGRGLERVCGVWKWEVRRESVGKRVCGVCKGELRRERVKERVYGIWKAELVRERVGERVCGVWNGVCGNWGGQGEQFQWGLGAGGGLGCGKIWEEWMGKWRGVRGNGVCGIWE